MAETIVACPKCSSKLKLKGDVVGKAVKCPKCSTAFKIGGKATASVPPVAGTQSSAKLQTAKKERVAGATPAKRPAVQKSAPAQASAAGKSTSQSAVRKKKVAGSSAAGLTASNRSPKKKKKRAPKPAQEEVYDDVAYDDVDYDDAGYDDDYGDDYGFDDGYSDSGAGASLPSRKKKKSSGKNGKKSKKSSSGGSLQDSVQKLGFVGWILCGCAAGLVGIFFTTLIGYTDIWFLICAMSLVTGSMVGGAVRFAAGWSQGWGPGIIAVVIGLASILAGRVGAFYVASENVWGDPEDNYTVEDEIAEATKEDALIGQIAGRIHEEWVESGKITEDQLTAFAEKLRRDFEAEYEEGDYEDYEVAEIDYSKSFMPEVWAEAKAEWDAKSSEEKAAAKKAREEEILDDWGVAEEAVQDFALLEAVVLAVISVFLSKSGFIFFCMGVFSSFKLGSNLGTDE